MLSPYCYDFSSVYEFFTSQDEFFIENTKAPHLYENYCSNNYFALVGLIKLNNFPNQIELLEYYRKRYIDARLLEKKYSGFGSDAASYEERFVEHINLITEAISIIKSKDELLERIKNRISNNNHREKCKQVINKLENTTGYWLAFFEFPEDLPDVKVKIKYQPKGTTFVLVASYVDDKVKKVIAKAENCVVITNDK